MREYLKNDLFEGIVSKKEFLALNNFGELDKQNIVLIAIHDPDTNIHSDEVIKNFSDSIQMKFWDVEKDFGKYKPISKSQALKLRKFILKNKSKKFLIHCMAGQSRSAGVACAVECLVNFDGNAYDYQTGHSDVKSHKRYSPNYTVFDRLILV